jgi:hypothetical protein
VSSLAVYFSRLPSLYLGKVYPSRHIPIQWSLYKPQNACGSVCIDSVIGKLSPHKIDHQFTHPDCETKYHLDIQRFILVNKAAAFFINATVHTVHYYFITCFNGNMLVWGCLVRGCCIERGQVSAKLGCLGICCFQAAVSVNWGTCIMLWILADIVAYNIRDHLEIHWCQKKNSFCISLNSGKGRSKTFVSPSIQLLESNEDFSSWRIMIEHDFLGRILLIGVNINCAVPFVCSWRNWIIQNY